MLSSFLHSDSSFHLAFGFILIYFLYAIVLSTVLQRNRSVSRGYHGASFLTSENGDMKAVAWLLRCGPLRPREVVPDTGKKTRRLLPSRWATVRFWGRDPTRFLMLASERRCTRAITRRAALSLKAGRTGLAR
jgi:hypothetical protein